MVSNETRSSVKKRPNAATTNGEVASSDMYENQEVDDESSLMSGRRDNFEVDDNRSLSGYQRSRLKQVRITKCKICSCICVFFGLLLIMFILGIHYYSIGIQNYLKLFLHKGSRYGDFSGCSDLSVEAVWSKGFPRRFSEGPIRLIHVNGDQVLDPIVPYGTGITPYQLGSDNVGLCRILFGSHDQRCFGGILALDGQTGDLLWEYKAIGDVHSLVCEFDLNSDGTVDCVGAGVLGVSTTSYSRCQCHRTGASFSKDKRIQDLFRQLPLAPPPHTHTIPWIRDENKRNLHFNKIFRFEDIDTPLLLMQLLRSYDINS
ncbi:hypothetical protein Ciccas_010735 [Cichlidogyrus casuarinus]|uniref:Uncharacterized protein n=1 Tax=Cichlidogyrus casuarinus TaxID=1844966 RepID=A0ABD2PT88_9PLAT